MEVTLKLGLEHTAEMLTETYPHQESWGIIRHIRVSMAPHPQMESYREKWNLGQFCHWYSPTLCHQKPPHATCSVYGLQNLDMSVRGLGLCLTRGTESKIGLSCDVEVLRWVNKITVFFFLYIFTKPKHIHRLSASFLCVSYTEQVTNAGSLVIGQVEMVLD